MKFKSVYNKQNLAGEGKMESSTPPTASSNDDSNLAQDPLALPNTNENIGMYANDVNRENGLCSVDAIKDNNQANNVYHNPSMKHDEHSLSNEQRLQYDGNHQMSSNYDQQKMNHLSLQQQQPNLHEPHKTFSHSIENLSKTTEKCAPNDIKM